MNASLDGKQPQIELNVWQKRQATLLYHFASLDYLKGLKQRLDALIKGADVTLETALAEGRDRFIVDERWGARDTAANWSTRGFPALLDFQQSVAKDIALRAFEAYEITGANQCAHMLSETSMRWATLDEEQLFKEKFELVHRDALNIDLTMARPRIREDGSFYNSWEDFKTLFPRLPKYRVRTDIEINTGKKPLRTGVYVPQDDPYGTLQFAWTGGEWDGSLDECQTFNELGREAVATVGRENLWNGNQKLLDFVKQRHGKVFEIFVRKWLGSIFEIADLSDSTSASAFISGNGLTTRPCKWYFVEKIEGESEDANTYLEASAAPTTQQRVPAGQPCPQSGWWFTPAKQNSRRYFKQGDVFPNIEGSAYGATFWQWDSNQI